MDKIKVIFRMEHDPYMDINKYLAIFPECKATLKGEVVCLPFWFNGDWHFESHTAICREYYYQTKYIKEEGLLKRLRNIVENYYNDMNYDTLKVKLIIRRKWV